MASWTAVKAMVIDDSQHMRRLITAILRGTGVETVDLDNCQAALRMTKAWQPDVILVDFEMRPMTGAEFTRALRAQERGTPHRAAVLMITAHCDRRRVLEAREAGVDGLLSKPISVGALLSRVNLVLQSKHSLRA